MFFNVTELVFWLSYFKKTDMKLLYTTAFLILGVSFAFAQSEKDTLKQENVIEEVKMVAKKPTVETKVDRTVFNVANSSVLAGNTTWDVLRMTPLVSIDSDDVVKSEGESVTVYINDRKSVFSGKELKEYLKSIPADNLMKIEVITNPSSRYETNGQVINIVLKKRDDEGFKGSISMTNTQNRRNNQYSNLNVNYHKKNFTQTLIGSYGENTNVYSSLNETHQFDENSFSTINQESVWKAKFPSLSSTSELELNDKNNIGLIIETYQNKSIGENSSDAIKTINEALYNTYHLEQTQNSMSRVLNSNVFYKYYDKVKNKILDVNLGVNYNGRENDRFFDKNQLINPVATNTRVHDNTETRNYYLKLDYSQPLDSVGTSIEAGAKFNFNNNVIPTEYYGFLDINNNPQNLSSRFKYTDNLNAVYANFSAKYFKNLDVRVGLRYEYITFKMHQDFDNSERKDSYGKLMPNVLLKYTFSPNFNISTSYNYNLWRPWYSEFDPFILPSNDGTYYRGNMFLNPNPNHRFTFKVGVYKKYFLSATYNFTNQDYWTDYYQDGQKWIAFENNFDGKSKRYNFSFNTNQTFFKNKFNVNLTVGVNYQDNSDFNRRNNLNMDSYLTSFTASSNFSYTNLFSKNINISGWVGVYQQNNGNSIGNNLNVFHNISVTKIFPNSGMEASLQLNNIFLRPVFDNTTFTQNGTIRNVNSSDWYGASVTFTKRFGNQKVKENTKTGVEKESGGGK